MREIESYVGQLRIYSGEEAKDCFIPLRDRIFDMSEGGLDWKSRRIFNDDSWIKIIIRGGVLHSDRSRPRPPYEAYETLDDWRLHDPRDELRPLVDLLIEDRIFEVVVMSPWPSSDGNEAVITLPSSAAIRVWLSDFSIDFPLDDRLLFDRTGRWGMYGVDDMFGLLGGEPAFMERFIERSGGMAFIREKADYFWQFVMDQDDGEAKWVPHFYKLAGWDNPPRKREG